MMKNVVISIKKSLLQGKNEPGRYFIELGFMICNWITVLCLNPCKNVIEII